MTPRQGDTDPKVSEASSLLARYLKGGRQDTNLLREIANIIVALRQEHQLADGRPDLGGRSPEYRADVKRIYEGARVPREDYDGIQTALRYHVNNRLHEIHEAETLTAAGLGQLSAKERLAHDREAAAQLRAALKDPILLAVRIAELANLLDGKAIAAEPTKRARAARLALEEAQECIGSALKEIDGTPARRRRRV